MQALKLEKVRAQPSAAKAILEAESGFKLDIVAAGAASFDPTLFANATIGVMRERKLPDNKTLVSRGLSTTRCEIVATSEFIPIAKGDTESESQSKYSININFGEKSSNEVNQIVRLIEMQRLLKNNITSLTKSMIQFQSGMNIYDLNNIANHMKYVLHNSIDEMYHNNISIDKLANLLIEESIDPSISNDLGAPTKQESKSAPRNTQAQAASEYSIPASTEDLLKTKGAVPAAASQFATVEKEVEYASWESTVEMSTNTAAFNPQRGQSALARNTLEKYGQAKTPNS